MKFAAQHQDIGTKTDSIFLQAAIENEEEEEKRARKVEVEKNQDKTAKNLPILAFSSLTHHQKDNLAFKKLSAVFLH